MFQRPFSRIANRKTRNKQSAGRHEPLEFSVQKLESRVMLAPIVSDPTTIGFAVNGDILFFFWLEAEAQTHLGSPNANITLAVSNDLPGYLIAVGPNIGGDPNFAAVETAGINTVVVTGSNFADQIAVQETITLTIELQGLDGDDVLIGGGSINSILGGAGNDTLVGLGGNDILRGGAGDDILLGGAGDDVLLGESGNDTLFGFDPNGPGSPTEINELRGGPNNDTIIGAAGADLIFGDENDDVIVGGAGNDEIHGGSGNDTIQGEDGDDSLFGDQDVDTVAGGIGNDTIVGGSGDDTLVGGTGNDNVSGEGGDDILLGEEGDDTLGGGENNDTLSGGSGNDTLLGGNGNDTLVGGIGIDNLSGEAGDDTLLGEDGDDTLAGGNNNDVLAGGNGADTLSGGDGDDTLAGESGIDSLFGGAGRDTLVGGPDDDLLSGDGDDDVLLGEDGSDTLMGGAGIDQLIGGAGDDTLSGEDGDDVVIGETGNDILFGGAGNDALVGGADSDFLFGGIGDDVYLFEPAATPEVNTIEEGENEGTDIVTFVPLAPETAKSTNHAGTSLAVATNQILNVATAGQQLNIEFGVNIDPFVEFVEAPTFGVSFEPLRFVANVVDVGTQVTHVVAFSFGDGNTPVFPLNEVNGRGTVDITHEYETFGIFQQVLVVVDMFGNFTALPNIVSIAEIAIRPDRTLAPFTALYVGGSTGDDTIHFSNGTLPGRVNVQINGRLYRNLKIDAGVYAFGGKGNDRLTLDPALTRHAHLSGGTGNDFLRGGDVADTLLGGDGNDEIFGGDGPDYIAGGNGADRLFGEAGNDILLGELGNDVLLGGTGRDLLIGGEGNDELTGGSLPGVLIGGTTIYDSDRTALEAIQEELRQLRGDGTQISAYVDNLMNGGGANGAIVLVPGVTVFDDLTPDTINAGGGSQLIFQGIDDELLNVGNEDIVV